MLSSTKQKTQQISIFGDCTLNLTTSTHTFKDTMSQDGNQNVVKFFVLITLVNVVQWLKCWACNPPNTNLNLTRGLSSYLPLLNF